MLQVREPAGPPVAEQDVLYTRDEAARFLRNSVATLERWARIGIGPKPIRIGRRCLYRLTDLRAFVGQQAA
jgi:hypothetical protein